MRKGAVLRIVALRIYLFSCQKLVQSSEKLFFKWVTITSRSLLDWEKVGRDRETGHLEGVCRALTQEQEKVSLGAAERR